MAELSRRSVIYETLIETGDAEKKLDKVADGFGKGAQESDKFKKTLDQQRQALAQAGAEFVKLQSNLKNTRDRIKELNKVNEEQKIKLQQAKQALKELEAEGGKFSARAGTLKKTIGELESAVADNNIALRQMKMEESELADQTGQTSKQIEGQTKSIKDLEHSQGKANKTLSGWLDNQRVFGVSIGQMRKRLTDFVGVMKAKKAALLASGAGFTSVSGALKIFRVALMATGIGAIVVAIVSLVALLSTSQGAIDKVSVALAGFKAAINSVIENVAKFGKGLALIFTGQWSKGFEELKSAFDSFVDSAKQAGSAMAQLQKDIQKLRDAEINYLVEGAKKRLEYDRLREEAGEAEMEDRKKALELNREAMKVLDEMEERELAFAREKFRIAQVEFENSFKKVEDREKLANAEKDLFQIESAFAKERLGMLRKIRTLSKETTKEEIGEMQKLQNAVQEAQKALENQAAAGKIAAETVERYKEAVNQLTQAQERYNDALRETQAFDVANYYATLEAATKRAFSELELALLQQRITEEEYTQEREKLIDRQLQQTIDRIEAEMNLLQSGTKEYINLENEMLEAKIWAEQQKRKEVTETAKHEIEERRAVEQAAKELVSQGAAAIGELVQRSGDKAIQELQDRKRRELEVEDLTNEQKREIEERFAREQRKIERQKAIAQRQAALFNIAINTAEKAAAIKAQAQVYASNYATAPLSANALAQLAILFASSALQTGLIMSAPLPALRKGTKSAKGGVTIVGEEGPELQMINPGAKVLDAQKTRLFNYLADLPYISPQQFPTKSQQVIKDYSTYFDRLTRNTSRDSFSLENGGTLAEQIGREVSKRTQRRAWF